MNKIKNYLFLCLGAAFLFASCESNNTDVDKVVDQQQNGYITEQVLKDMISEVSKETKEGKLESKVPVEVVDYVNLEKYKGRWYEIAKYPAIFTAGCTCTTADYELAEDGQSIDVFNNCTIAFTNIKNSINGNAVVVDKESNAKLKVSFDNVPGEPGDYWIINLISLKNNGEYDFSVVSGPDRKNLFILSRTPKIKTKEGREALYSILRDLHKKDFSLLKLLVSPQLGTCEYPE